MNGQSVLAELWVGGWRDCGCLSVSGEDAGGQVDPQTQEHEDAGEKARHARNYFVGIEVDAAVEDAGDDKDPAQSQRDVVLHAEFKRKECGGIKKDGHFEEIDEVARGLLDVFERLK